MVSIDLLTFDLSDCSLEEQSEDSKVRVLAGELGSF